MLLWVAREWQHGGQGRLTWRVGCLAACIWFSLTALLVHYARREDLCSSPHVCAAP
jgi:hypothetical protein